MVSDAPSYTDCGAATRKCSSDATDVRLGAKHSALIESATLSSTECSPCASPGGCTCECTSIL